MEVVLMLTTHVQTVTIFAIISPRLEHVLTIHTQDATILAIISPSSEHVCLMVRFTQATPVAVVIKGVFNSLQILRSLA
jgi:hypothetical protein